jgi:exosortase
MAASIPQQSPVKDQDHELRTKLILASLVSLGVLAVLYGLVKYSLGYGQVRETIFNAVFAQWQLEDWGHCMIVPFAAGFIVYLERGKLAAIRLSGAGGGFWMLCLGFFLYWFGFKADDIYFSYVAGQLLIAALVIWFCGWEWMRVLTFPWLLLIFMWPLLFLESFISFPLRLLVSHAGVAILNIIGVHSVLNGTGILSAADPLRHLAQGELFAVDVALPCSGMRSLFALMMVSALYGYFTIRSAWGRLTLFLLSVPLAIAGNICRIVMLTLGTMLLGVEKAIGTLDRPSFFHMLAGYVVFLVALGGMVLIAGWISPEKTKKLSVTGAGMSSPPTEVPGQIKSDQKDRGDLY